MFCYFRNISACLLFASLQLFVLFAKAQPAKAQVSSKDTTKSKLDFNKVYQGEIDSSDQVIFKLSAKAGIISGKCYFIDFAKEVPVSGRIDKLGNIQLEGVVKFRDRKFTIRGEFVSQKLIIGYSLMIGIDTMRREIYLNESLLPYDTIKRKLISSKLNYISGDYSDNDDVKSEDYHFIFSNRLMIKKLSNKKFKFEMTSTKTYEKISDPDVSDDCSCYINEIGYIDSLGIGRFTNSECKQLKFYFTKKSVFVEEKECDDYCGWTCDFSTVFYRVKKL